MNSRRFMSGSLLTRGLLAALKAISDCGLVAVPYVTPKRGFHVRFGSNADIEARPLDVRFTPESKHRARIVALQLVAGARLDRQIELKQRPLFAVRRRNQSTAMMFNNHTTDS